MSVESPVKKAIEYLTDSNILSSKKTYGKKIDYGNVSVSNEKHAFFSTSLSGHLKSNGTSFESSYIEDIYYEKNFESVTTVLNNGVNNDVQKESVGSEICLFNDADTEYYFAISTDCPRKQDSNPTPEASTSGSHYQRTRKNLKHRLSNQRYSSEETPETTSYENSNFLNDSKSPCKVFNSKQVSSSIKQNFPISIDNQEEKTKNGMKASVALADKLPQNPTQFQTFNKAEKISSTETIFQNPPKKSSNGLSILDLVNRFAVSSNQASLKTDSSNKRKKSQKECESVLSKKASLVKYSTPSKVSSVEKKTLNSPISVKNYSKNTILKIDTINTASFQVKLTKSNSKSPSKTPRQRRTPKKINDVPLDSMIKSVKNSRLPKKDDVQTASKVVQKEHYRSVGSTERTIQVLQKYVSKNKTTKNHATSKVKCPPSSSLLTSDMHLVRSESAPKVQLYNVDKEIAKPSFTQTKECTFQNQGLKDISEKNDALNCVIPMPMIIAPNPPLSQEGEMAPLCLWVPSSTTGNSIQNGNLALSDQYFKDVSIPGPSTLNNDNSISDSSDYCVTNVHAEGTTTTTIINKTDHQKHFFRPRTHINDGTDFFGFMINSLKDFENNGFLKCKEEPGDFFFMNPSLLNFTVKEFCDVPLLTDVLIDYINGFDLDKPLAVPNPNKGYDFPENFDNENLLRVVKDFVHTAISCMIPANAPEPVHISYSRIIKTAMLKMSSREFSVITRVFKKTDQLLGLKDVCAKLSLVALFVIFDEYKNRKHVNF